MILWIALPTLLIYALVAAAALAYLGRVETGLAQARMTRQATNYARQFDLLLREAAAVADTTAHLLEVEPRPSEEQIYALLESNVGNNRHIYGSACAFEPGAYKADDSLYSPYVYRGGDALARINIDRSVYDWYNDPQWQWFRLPKQRGVGTWTDPYFDEGAGNALMTTYSAPFFLSGEFRGVVTVDILLPQLQGSLGREIDPDLDFVILTRDGRFVYSPDSSRILAKTIFDVVAEAGRPELPAVARRVLAGDAGVARVQAWDSPVDQWLFFAPIASPQWTFLAHLPESLVLIEARRKALLLVGAMGITLALTSLAICVVSARLSAPIKRLRDGALRIAEGDLDARVQASESGDEVDELARSFNKMADDLRVHIKRIAEQEAARQRIDHELDLARDIQVHLLPSTPPSIEGYEICGWSRPADKTGGDYFDWQTLPDGRVVVSIADATGHGIAPALVTAVCRAYARASFSSGHGIAGLVARINDLLADDLSGDRFVTFAAVFLDARSHTLELLSAGHGPLFYFRAAQNEVVSYDSHGLPLAVLRDSEYGPMQPIGMEIGDALILVTDGFFEWMGPDRKIFGTERLAQVLRQAASRPATELIQAAYQAVLAYADGSPQEDDLTAVVIKRTG